jgi:PAT family beta-lactamase induction signal transducer AmpG
LTVPAAFRPTLPSLAEHKLARFAAIVILYFMQGVPLGLTLVAIPAWLAASGASPTAIGVFVGTAMLPWSLKLFNGLLMDRFTFKPMGRRRSWILIAQAMMAITLVALAVAAPSAAQVGLLAWFCFTLNICATFNDVAVDGMAVDLVPDHERTTVNGFMFASQAIGVSATSFVAGQLLVIGEISAMALVLAAFVAIVSAFVAIFRERPGERLLPWSEGKASPECEERQQDAWWPIIQGVFRTLASPLIVLFLLGMALSQANWSFVDAVSPPLAVQQLGWGSDQFSSFSAMAGLASAIAAAILTPLLVRLFGLRNAIAGLFAFVAALALVGGATFSTWQGDRVFLVLYSLQYGAGLLLNILLIVWAMRVCNPAVAASQFALFMAVPNLSRSIFSGYSGWLAEHGGYALTYLAVAGVMLVGLAITLKARVGKDAGAASNHNLFNPQA